MHYREFKQNDPQLAERLIRAFPFAVIAVNGEHGPAVAQAPLTFRPGSRGQDAVDFHLAKANSASKMMESSGTAAIVVNGPSAHVSPSWYTQSFAGKNPDRSRTAPTWDYVSLTIRGSITRLDDERLSDQIKTLVHDHEPVGGLRIEEIDPGLYKRWCEMLIGFRVEIESIDITTKLSQDHAPDRPGVIDGLRHRGGFGDGELATLIEAMMDSPDSFASEIGSMRKGGRR